MTFTDFPSPNPTEATPEKLRALATYLRGVGILDAADLVDTAADEIDTHRPHQPEPEIKTDYTRDELVALCVRAVVPVTKWHDRDSARTQEKIGRAWALLSAGCEFIVIPPHPEGAYGCYTNERTIWLEIEWPGFNAVEWGRGDRSNWENDRFYLPTPARLEASTDRDWY